MKFSAYQKMHVGPLGIKVEALVVDHLSNFAGDHEQYEVVENFQYRKVRNMGIANFS